MNLTSKNFETSKKNNGISGGDFTTIDKYFEESSNDITNEQFNAFINDEIQEEKNNTPGTTGHG